MFGPVSGGQFNPVVSFVDARFGGISRRDAFAYLPAQVCGCILGAIVANVMFSVSAISISTGCDLCDRCGGPERRQQPRVHRGAVVAQRRGPPLSLVLDVAQPLSYCIGERVALSGGRSVRSSQRAALGLHQQVSQPVLGHLPRQRPVLRAPASGRCRAKQLLYLAAAREAQLGVVDRGAPALHQRDAASGSCVS
jgi:hypothetical protein